MRNNWCSILFLVFLSNSIIAQDFIKMKDGSIKEVRITHDYPDRILFKEGDQHIQIDKISIDGYVTSNGSSKRKPDLGIWTKDGKSFYGKLLYASDSQMIVFRGARGYSPWVGQSITISNQEINSIVLNRKGSFKKGAIIGVSVGVGGGIALLIAGQGWIGFGVGLIPVAIGTVVVGSIGAASKIHFQMDSLNPTDLIKAMPTLKKYAMLKTVPLINDSIRAPSEQWSEKNSAQIISANKLYPRISIWVAGGWQVISGTKISVQNSLVESGYEIESHYGYIGPIDLGIDYSINSKSGTGINYNLQPSISYYSYNGGETTGRNSFEVFYSRTSNLYESYPRKFEIKYAIGASINFLSYYGYWGNGSVGSDYFDKSVKPGLVGFLSLDYFLAQNLCLTSRVGGRLMPGMEIPQLIDYQAHSIHFNSLSLTFGLKFNF